MTFPSATDALPQSASYRARWVFPVSSPPLEKATLVVEQGRITDIHQKADSRAIDLGNVALLPGLVNCHTHLEFSDLAKPVEPATPFTRWIRSLVAYRLGLGTASFAQPPSPLTRGLAETQATGTVLVGEIATSNHLPEAYHAPQTNPSHLPHVVAFREVLGFPRARLEAQAAVAREWVSQPGGEAGLVRGLSPHAPYSVHPDLYQEVVTIAQQTRVPVAVHLAETMAELEFLRSATGEFRQLLEQFGAWEEGVLALGTRPLDYLKPLEQVTRGLIIHGNYLSDEECAWLSHKPHLTVIYCPRTHAYFGHRLHPWRKLLEQGVRVAIGTDGRGSNPDLSLWKELQFLRQRFPEVSPAMLLELGTLAGARALGQDHNFGVLSPGRLARMALARLPETNFGDPYTALFTAHRLETFPV